MRVFGCAWKINFPEVIFSWPCVLVGLTRKLDSVQIFTSNHFRTHVQREKSPNHSSDRAPVQQPTLHRSRQSQHRADRTGLITPRHTSADPHQHRSTLAPIKQRSTPTPIASRQSTPKSDDPHQRQSPIAPRRSSKDWLQRRSISPLSCDLASRSNPVTSLSSFFSQFDRIWWIFFF